MTERKNKDELVDELKEAGLPTDGTKAELEERLEAVESGTVHVPDSVGPIDLNVHDSKTELGE